MEQHYRSRDYFLIEEIEQMIDLCRRVSSVFIAMTLVLGCAATAWADHESAFQAIERGDVAALKAEIAKNASVVNSRNQYGMPPLNRAAMTSCVNCAKLLLDSGADTKAIDKTHGRTALHCAAGWSTVGMVQLLLSRGAAINARSANGDTPLAFARDNFFKDKYDERTKIATVLIKAGAK